MYLYDTATRGVTQFPGGDGRVGIYVCGITPYDGGHLGHAFTYHTFDVVARRLRGLGRDVRMVRNVTDVDDDMMRVARERQRPYLDIAAEQVASFERDMADIGIAAVDASPRASESVPAIIAWVDRLERAGAAYAQEGWVYFDITAYPRYGSLSKLDSDAMRTLSAERGANPDDPRKRNPLDFVLWQPSLPDEPSWTARWGAGRPGWHIECTVMAADELGIPLTLHGGGEDLVYPHHESEIAQAEALPDVPRFCDHWMHVSLVAYQGAKMSKSLGNLVFVRDMVAQRGPGAVRLLLCRHHYRSTWEYLPEELDSAAAQYARYMETLRGAHRLDVDAAAALREEFNERLDDDLDLPGCLGVLDTLASERTEGDAGTVPASDLMTELLGCLGIPLSAPAPAAQG